jgi:uncharacterized membrane protein
MRETPEGWDYNPSTWRQRLPLVGVALVGFGIAVYLTLYQTDVVSDVWEPFFGSGSREILNSGVSHALPVPDAALGAFGYLLDAVAGLVGGRQRWRTMPWMVLVFGAAVGPLGAVSVALTIIQPAVYGTFCTLCLASAAISLMLIPPAMDEVLASLQELARVRRRGGSAWRFLWSGEAGAHASA